MNNAPTVSVVVNPSAGGGRARRILPRIMADLVTGLPTAEIRLHQATSASDAERLCRAAVKSAQPAQRGQRADPLIVVGGDGMMHLGLNACAESGVPLGLIAAGRGNDFCRGVGVPSDLAGAVATIVAGRRDSIDLLRVSGEQVAPGGQRWVGSILSTGFDARVNYRTNHLRWNLGRLSYAWAALAELSRFEPLDYRLEVDGQVRELPAMFVAVGNAGWFGGGMQGCVGADVQDGLLDLTIVHPMSRMTLLRLLPRMFDGGYVRDPAIERLRASRVVVSGEGLYGMADGEEIGPVPLRLQVMPGALELYRPPTLAQRRGAE